MDFPDLETLPRWKKPVSAGAIGRCASMATTVFADCWKPNVRIANAGRCDRHTATSTVCMNFFIFPKSRRPEAKKFARRLTADAPCWSRYHASRGPRAACDLRQEHALAQKIPGQPRGWAEATQLGG